LESNNTFAYAIIVLAAAPTEFVYLDNLKPGDRVERFFELQNNGTLDDKRVLLEPNYTLNHAENDNTDDFGKHIQVKFLYNSDQAREVVYETTLYKIKDMDPEAEAE